MGISTYSYTNSGGSPAGKSGSPASNGQACGGCHGGGSPNGNEMVDIFVRTNPGGSNAQFSTSVIPSEDTEIVLRASAAGTSKMGFCASIEDASGNHVGLLSAGNGNAKIVSSDYVTHKSTSTSVSGDSIQWIWDWNSGNIEDSATIYVAVNYTNGNGGTGGDYSFTASKTIYENDAFSTEENRKSGLVVSPNPAIDQLKVRSEGLVEVRLYNTIGRFIQLDYTAALEDEALLDVSALARGKYILHAEYSDGTVQYKHVVLQ